jgi:hypothetical protein
MDQNGTATHDPNQPDPQTTIQQPPVDQNGSSVPNSNKGKYTRTRIFLFISLPILILLFNSNTIAISVITTILILLSISDMFGPVANNILKYTDILLSPFFISFKWIWDFLFVKHLKRLGNWLTKHRRSVIDIVAIIAILILLGATTLSPFVTTVRGKLSDYACLQHGWSRPCNSGVGVSSLRNGVRIGLITDNTYGPFDQSTFNQDEKNVEGLIFTENRQACTGQHTTLIVATMLSRTVEDPQNAAVLGLQHLQGDYLAQHHYNATHPARPLCLAIANLGTPDTANNTSLVVNACSDCYSMPQVMHQIAQFAHADSSVHGIVGFPFSQQVKEALQIIKDDEQSLALLPIISPSASSDNFSDTTNFYRIDLPDQNQAGAMAQFFCHHLMQNQSSSSIAILMDPSDFFSGDLPIDFRNNVNCLDSTHKFFPILYKNGDSASILNAIDVALQQDHANYIFFPGYDQDLDTIESEIHKDLQGNAKTVTIIGGDGINNVNVTTHYSYTLVYSVNFAQPLPNTEPFVQDFIKDGFFKPYTTPIPAIPAADFWMPTDTFLNIDAVQAFTHTLQILHNPNFTQEEFNAALRSISFQGETGNVTLQGNRVNSGHRSDRTEQNAYITCYDYQHILHLVDSYDTLTDTGSVQENPSIPDTSPCS